MRSHGEANILNVRQKQRHRRVAALLVSTAAALAWAQCASATETRSYVIGWFAQAAYSQEDDCPGGVNPDIGEQYRKDLAALGKSKTEIDALMTAWQKGGPRRSEFVELVNNRGRVDGKPVNAYAHPEAVVDPKLKSIKSKYAYGFDLDGKISPEDFTDPRTKQQGIDHQLFRALGCIQPFRGSWENSPTYWTWAWTMTKTSMPAWLITLSGDDLDRDGEINITFDRALEHVTFNSNGEARSNMTFRASSDPRSHHTLRGQIKNGVISVTQPGELRLLNDPLSFPVLTLEQTHLRLEIKEDGSLEGLLGGYQPWRPIYFAFAQGGYAAETTITGELPGIYYLLKKAADADPDPKTGQNRAISVAYQVVAVPAFVVPEQSIEADRLTAG